MVSSNIKNASDPVRLAVAEIKRNEPIWESYLIAVREARGYDLDFPNEDGTGPVAEVWRLNSILHDIAYRSVPEIPKDKNLIREFNNVIWTLAQMDLE